MTSRVSVTLVAAAGAVLLAAGCARDAKTYATPEEAATALAGALQPYDSARLNEVLGGGADDLLASGDEVADRSDAETFVKAYQQRHRFETASDGTVNLLVGDDDWPMPIPLVSTGSGYQFDLEAGKSEVIARRIGRNELDTIEVCRAVIDAQQEYFALQQASTGKGAYARKFISDPGTRNGLYWPAAEGEPESPLGPLVAEASEQGYPASLVKKEGGNPFHGYCYMLLTAQGSSAPGGARPYFVDNALREGYAFVAYPVEYGQSGIMTFIASHNGVVFQSDLGESTDDIVRKMIMFNPDQSWTVVEP